MITIIKSFARVLLSYRSAFCVVAFAVVGGEFVCGQDTQAVEQRLLKSVRAGEMTLEQAAAMMETLRQHSSKSKPALSQQPIRGERLLRITPSALGANGRLDPSDWPRIKKGIEQLVTSGQLTEAEANAKYRSIQTLMQKQTTSQPKAAKADDQNVEPASQKQQYMALLERIKAAVARGELSEAEAAAKITEIKKKFFAQLNNVDETKARYEKIVKQLKSAVESGDLSEDEAQQKLDEIKRQILNKNGK